MTENEKYTEFHESYVELIDIEDVEIEHEKCYYCGEIFKGNEIQDSMTHYKGELMCIGCAKIEAENDATIMPIHEQTRVFKKFLRERGLLGFFKKEIKQQFNAANITIQDYMNLNAKGRSLDDVFLFLISSVCVWHTHFLGFDFWFNLDAQLYDYFTNNDKFTNYNERKGKRKCN